MDSSPGRPIAKILRTFTEQTFPSLMAIFEDGVLTLVDAESCTWAVRSYPQTVRALAKLPEFNNEREADLYICGYYRGLQMAAFRMGQAKHKTAKKKRHVRKVSFT
jgi:hypothetical protein